MPANTTGLDDSIMNTAVRGLVNAALAGGMSFPEALVGIGAGIGYLLAELPQDLVDKSFDAISAGASSGMQAGRLYRAKAPGDGAAN